MLVGALATRILCFWVILSFETATMIPSTYSSESSYVSQCRSQQKELDDTEHSTRSHIGYNPTRIDASPSLIASLSDLQKMLTLDPAMKTCISLENSALATES